MVWPRGLASVKARREPRGLVRHDMERRQTPTRIKTVVLWTLWSYWPRLSQDSQYARSTSGIGGSGVPGTYAPRHRKLRNPDEKLSYGHIETGRMDQRLNQAGMRQPKGRVENSFHWWSGIREDRDPRHRNLRNPESRYRTKDWHFANAGLLEISHLWEINPKFLKIMIVGVLQSGIRAWLQHSSWLGSCTSCTSRT